MLRSILTLGLCFLSLSGLAESQQLPEYIEPCPKASPNVNKCLEGGLRQLIKHLATGIPELGVPPIEPFLVPIVQMENNAGSIRIKAVISNMTIYGMSNHTITDIRANAHNYKIDIAGRIPRITATGLYEVSGTVLLLNIRSKGEFWATFEDLSGLSVLQGVEFTGRDQVKYLKVDRVGMDFKIGKAKFNVKETTRNSIFGEAMSMFLNKNWKALLQELKPAVSSVLVKYLKDFINPIFHRIPIDLWLVDAEPAV